MLWRKCVILNNSSRTISKPLPWDTTSIWLMPLMFSTLIEMVWSLFKNSSSDSKAWVLIQPLMSVPCSFQDTIRMGTEYWLIMNSRRLSCLMMWVIWICYREDPTITILNKWDLRIFFSPILVQNSRLCGKPT